MKKYGLLFALMLLSVPSIGLSADVPWYVGVNGGVSSLRPDTQNSPFTLDSTATFGAGAFAGYDFSDRISLELGYNFLGSAKLSSNNDNPTIGYTALSGSGLLYLYGDAESIAYRNGFAGYVRLGVSSMDNSSTIPLEREDNVAVLVGAGFEMPLMTDINIRGELSSFDGDAQMAHASIVYRPNSQRRGRGSPVVRAPQAPRAPEVYQEPQQQQRPQQRPAPQVNRAPQQQRMPTINRAPNRVPQQQRAPAVSRAPQQQAQVPTFGIPLTDSPLQGQSNQANCSAPAIGEPSDLRGCALFSGKLRGVEFVSGTATLTPIAAKIVDRVAQNMLRYRDIVIEIQAHTESFGNAARANAIAKQRTIVIARRLAGRGVPTHRLRARAYGHARPVAMDNTVAGRRLNNRIELRVLR